MGLAHSHYSQGPLSIWHGPQIPRCFATLETPRGYAVAAGELIWQKDQLQEQGQAELPRLLQCLLENRPQELAQANGTFAALAWDAASSRLWLVADSLGGRPLYFAEAAGTLYFSTILDVLLRIPAIPGTLDFDAFIEKEALYCPLGDRTLRREIRVLRDSEYLRWSPGHVERERYFDWSRIEFQSLTLEQAAEHCAAALAAAVADRAPRPGEEARVILSGGLDSRCVAALLHELGVPLRAATLRIPGTQDYHYAWRFADLIGSELVEAPYEIDPAPFLTGIDVIKLLSSAARPFLPGRVFSGDGGGETFGLLLLNPKFISYLAQGNTEAALREYAAKHPVNARIFRGPWSRAARNRPLLALREALAEYSHMPPEKAMHLFVLTSDLRRHLHDFFDIAPRIGCDLVTPFYDRRVLMSVLRLAPPLAPFLQHRLYHEVVKLMPEPCARVPWQTYPGKLPCPVPDDGPALKTQWDWQRELRPVISRRFAREMGRDLLRWRAPASYLNLPVLAAAWVLHTLRCGNYAHLFRLALALTDEVHYPRAPRRDRP
ncbi:MAG: asparagine synthase-related protein [Acidobacteriota bacterium]